MKRRYRLPILLILPCLALALGGCPQHIEKIASEMIPPENYKPVYMTQTIPFARIMEAHRLAIERGEISATDTASFAPLAMEIRNVDDSRYPNEIELRAFVYDTNGRFVMGLAPPYFAGTGSYRDYWRRLVDSCSGQAVPIDSFTVTEVREDKREPWAIAYLLDHSGSMGETRVRRLREAIGRTLRSVKSGDRISVLTFTQSVTEEMPLTGDTAVFRRRFNEDNLSAYGGGTAIYDAALAGIAQVRRAPAGHRRAIVLFTDGADGSSRSTVDMVHRAARENHVTIYTIAYGMTDESTLRNMAEYTGGRMYRIYSSKEFPYVFADIYRRLNNYYRITYRPPECQGLHTATASLTIPELGGERLLADGRYDRSIFTPFDSVGQVAFLNIEFDYDKATIREGSMAEIREIADAMRSLPTMKVEIRGHTDDRGGDDYNMKLSLDRAESVADALAEMGIDRRRLSVRGLGETQPLAPNDSDENRRRNRRTEFVIVSR